MNKILSGAMSVVPLFTFVVYIIMCITALTELGWIALWFIVTCLTGLIDAIWFIIIALKKKDWPIEKKVIWAILLYTFGMFTFPIFWFLHIRTT